MTSFLHSPLTLITASLWFPPYLKILLKQQAFYTDAEKYITIEFSLAKRAERNGKVVLMSLENLLTKEVRVLWVD